MRPPTSQIALPHRSSELLSSPGRGLRRLSSVIASAAPIFLLLFQPEFQSNRCVFGAEGAGRSRFARLSLGSLSLPSACGLQRSLAYLIKRRGSGDLSMVRRLSSAHRRAVEHGGPTGCRRSEHSGPTVTPNGRDRVVQRQMSGPALSRAPGAVRWIAPGDRVLMQRRDVADRSDDARRLILSRPAA